MEKNTLNVGVRLKMVAPIKEAHLRAPFSFVLGFFPE